ncbi:MAG: hypothetical protein CM1200mP39_13580 [Dehalococcoidia bacterium]|nr:MAG: hypothetical protein CM1200mP39_13580 [Dehalococcoidia bacterium]
MHANDFVHLVASIVWSGGVIYLTFSVPIFIKHLGKEGASKLFEKAIDKFTVLGVQCWDSRNNRTFSS